MPNAPMDTNHTSEHRGRPDDTDDVPANGLPERSTHTAGAQLDNLCAPSKTEDDPEGIQYDPGRFNVMTMNSEGSHDAIEGIPMDVKRHPLKYIQGAYKGH